MSNKWNNIATVRKDVKGNNFLVFRKGVSILLDGQEIDLGGFRTARCFNATESVEGLAAKGKINQEDLAKRLEYIADKNISFEVVIPPSAKTEG